MRALKSERTRELLADKAAEGSLRKALEISLNKPALSPVINSASEGTPRKVKLRQVPTPDA